MKCQFCKVEIKQFDGGRLFIAIKHPHTLYCRWNTLQPHEPEPTEAAPSPVENYDNAQSAFISEQVEQLAEREAVVGGQSDDWTGGYIPTPEEMSDPNFCSACCHVHTHGQIECFCYCDKVSCKRCGPRIANRVVADTPRPEMGKAVIADGIYARVESALQHGVISETWPEIWTAIRPIIEQLEVSLQDDLKYRITPTVILAAASGTESAPTLEMDFRIGWAATDICRALNVPDKEGWYWKTFTEILAKNFSALKSQPSPLTPPSAISVLKRLYEETADYIRINNLGDVHHNQSMKDARDVLASSLTQAGPPSLTQIKEWIISRGEFTPFDPNGSYVVSGWQLMTMLESWAAQSQKGGGE